ncbi:MAG: hypothetical protein NXI22_10165 [bacterium]|nr:hypothetical protein [bacterium]
MTLKWYSLWYSGEYRSTDGLWQTWHSLVSEFFEQNGLEITYFGAGSDRFRSGKYLKYHNGRKRLLQAFADQDDFRYLSFLEMKSDSYNTLAGDNSFRVSLNSNQAKGLMVDVRLEDHDQQLGDSFRGAAETLFSKARLISYKTPTRIDGAVHLPCNLPINYDRAGNDVAKKYVDVATMYIQTE